MQMRMELHKHARRLARLARINLLATKTDDKKSIGRIEKLIELENKRHEKKMEMLTSKLADQKPAVDKEDKGGAI